MDFALAFGIFLLGLVLGALVAIAIMSDKPRYADIHSGRDDVENRSRQAF
jgi:hypothetical protein